MCKESISQRDRPESESSQEARAHLMSDPSYPCTSPDKAVFFPFPQETDLEVPGRREGHFSAEGDTEAGGHHPLRV